MFRKSRVRTSPPMETEGFLSFYYVRTERRFVRHLIVGPNDDRREIDTTKCIGNEGSISTTITVHMMLVVDIIH